jgi:hypothetical protein
MGLWDWCGGKFASLSKRLPTQVRDPFLYWSLHICWLFIECAINKLFYYSYFSPLQVKKKDTKHAFFLRTIYLAANDTAKFCLHGIKGPAKSWLSSVSSGLKTDFLGVFGTVCIHTLDGISGLKGDVWCRKSRETTSLRRSRVLNEGGGDLISLQFKLSTWSSSNIPSAGDLIFPKQDQFLIFQHFLTAILNLVRYIVYIYSYIYILYTPTYL